MVMAISARKRGFALILALSLVSFFVLLVLAISTLSRIASQAAQNSQKLELARQNALLALRVALGELQQYAGPDQRVTARAEILNPSRVDLVHPYWTGVWDTTVPEQAPLWLVSGSDPDPQKETTEAVLLLGAASVGTDASRHVYAPRVAIESLGATANAGLQTTGHYAYWISDEGIKASAALIDKLESLGDPRYQPREKRRLRQQSARRFRLESIFGEDLELMPFKEGSYNEVVKGITNAKVLQQLQFVKGIEAGVLQRAYFDVTLLARGVLADTEQGGLKKDLSVPDFRNPSGALPIDDAVQSFLQNRANGEDKFPMQGVDADVYDSDTRTLGRLARGSPIFSTPPVVCEIVLYLAAFRKAKTSDRAGVFLATRADLWTPYSLPLAFEGGNTPDLRIRFRNMPRVTVEYGTLQESGDYHYAGQSVTLDWDEVEPEFSVDISDTMRGGEVRYVTTKWEGNGRTDYYHPHWEWGITDVTPANKADDFFRYRVEGGRSDIEILDNEGSLLQVFKNVPFQQIYTGDDLIKEAWTDTASEVTLEDYPVRFRLRFDDDFSAHIQLWASVLDPRQPIVDFQDPDPERRAWVNDLFAVYELDSIEQDFRAAEFFSGFNFRKNYYRLFDVPSQPPISVGVLHHIGLYQERPASVGNAWGGAKNEVFDRYYFSTVSREKRFWKPKQRVDGAPGLGFEPLPNSRLEVYDPDNTVTLGALQSENSAQHLFIAGAFNINSTSVNAWKAVLAANNIYDWEYRNTNDEVRNRARVWNAFFRLPFGGDRHFSRRSFGKEISKYPVEHYLEYPNIGPTEMRDWFQLKIDPDWAPSWNLGVRELTDEHIERLAFNIVESIQDRGRPFISIKDFLNDPEGGELGLLQRAIDQTNINTLSGQIYQHASDEDRIPRHATAFLSQADIASALAPFISARSDTFVIRAYGDRQNPVTGALEARAWCEALVQRLPARVDGGAIMANAEGLGRRFQIVHFRWLNVTDI